MAPSPATTASPSGISITPVRPSPSYSPSSSADHHATVVAILITLFIGFLCLACSILLWRLRRRALRNGEVRRRYMMTYRPTFHDHDKKKKKSRSENHIAKKEVNETQAMEMRNEHAKRVETFLQDNPDCYVPRNVLPVTTMPMFPIAKGGAKRKQHTIPRFSQYTTEVVKGKIGSDGLVHFENENQQAALPFPHPGVKGQAGIDCHPHPLASNPLCIGVDDEAAQDTKDLASEEDIGKLGLGISLEERSGVGEGDSVASTLKALRTMDDEAIDAMGPRDGQLDIGDGGTSGSSGPMKATWDEVLRKKWENEHKDKHDGKGQEEWTIIPI